MLKNALLTLTLCAATLFAIGCEQQPQTPPGTVALIELDRIAAATGKDKQITDQIQAKQTELMGRANGLRRQMEGQFRAVQQQMGESPTDQQKSQLQAMLAEMQRQLTSEQMQANYEMEQFRSNMAAELRSQVREPALAVAKEKGFSIVFETNNAIVAALPSVDITDDVIQRMTAQPSAGGDSMDARLAPNSMPPLNLPPNTTNAPVPMPQVTPPSNPAPTPSPESTPSTTNDAAAPTPTTTPPADDTSATPAE